MVVADDEPANGDRCRRPCACSCAASLPSLDVTTIIGAAAAAAVVAADADVVLLARLVVLSAMLLVLFSSDDVVVFVGAERTVFCAFVWRAKGGQKNQTNEP